jgi:hypothetical protein
MMGKKEYLTHYSIVPTFQFLLGDLCGFCGDKSVSLSGEWIKP